MDIQNVSLNTNINNSQSKVSSVQNDDFRQLLHKITGGSLIQKIRDTYDVTLNVDSIGTVNDLLNTYDIRCTNYVLISPETLSKMEDNPALKKKIMSAIEVFCSPEEQAEINDTQKLYESTGISPVVNDLESAMQILGTACRRTDE